MTFPLEIMEQVGVIVIDHKQPKGVTPKMSGHKFSSGVFCQRVLKQQGRKKRSVKQGLSVLEYEFTCYVFYFYIKNYLTNFQCF